jgi:hypothetical protein
VDCDICRREWEIHCLLDNAINVWRSDMEAQSIAELTEQQLQVFANTVYSPNLPTGLRDSAIAELTIPAMAMGSLVSNHGAVHRGLSQSGQASTSNASVLNHRSGVLAVVSVAACLLLVVIFATNRVSRNSAEFARVVPSAVLEHSTNPTPLDVSQTLTTVFSDIRSEYREMASETTAVARDIVNVFPQHVTVPIPASRDEVELHPTSGDVVRIWRPISSRVESALGFLWQAVPSEVPAG